MSLRLSHLYSGSVCMSRRSQLGQSTAAMGCGVVAVLAIVIGAVLLLTSHAQVDAGQVGVVSHWGAIDVNERPLTPGWHWITPFSGVGVVNVSVQQQNHKFSEVSTASRENQNVFVDGGINFHITPGEAAGIETNGGLDAYIQRIFNPAFQDYIKEVTPSYTTAPGDKDNVLTNRAKIRDKVLQRLRDKASDPAVTYHITVDDLFLTDIHFDKSYNDAIEKAAVAQQQLAQAKIDAAKAVAVAQGQGDALRAAAQGEADANRVKAASISDTLNAYLAIQKWDGKLPTVTGGSIPMVTLPAAPAK